MKARATTAIGILAIVAPVWAGDVYRWTDSSGRVHYTNTRVARDRPDAPRRTPTADATRAEDTGYSTQVSIRRSALARSLEETRGEIDRIDGELTVLERVRRRNAEGSAATGGVGAPADVLSPAEEELARHREKLVQHEANVRRDVSELRREVEAHYGSTPSWWVDP